MCKVKALDRSCFSGMLEQPHGQREIHLEADLNLDLVWTQAVVKTTRCHQAHCIMSQLIQLRPTQ